MRDDPHIACGIYPFILKDTKFIDACSFHDSAYLNGSFLQRKEWTRKQVDQWFLQQMLLMSKTRLDRLQAYTFYYIARLAGGPFYEHRS